MKMIKAPTKRSSKKPPPNIEDDDGCPNDDDDDPIVPYPMPDQPTYDIPEMPWDIGGLGPDELMELMGQFTQWANFFGVEAANADAAEESIEISLTNLEAGFLLAPGSINTARAKRDAAPEVVKMKHDLHVAKHRRKLIEALFKNCERSAAALSRELTRRTAMMRLEGRGGGT